MEVKEVKWGLGTARASGSSTTSPVLLIFATVELCSSELTATVQIGMLPSN